MTSKKPYCITNVDSSKQKGSHWVAVYRDNKKKKYLVFDSFGRPTKDLIPSAYKKYKPEDTDYDRNQKIIENTCGPKSLAWLMICDHYGYDTAKLV